MTPQPNPTRRLVPFSSERQAARLRKLNCARYDQCLRVAGAKHPDAPRGWESFTCLRCEIDEPVPLEPISTSAGTSLLAALCEERGQFERGPTHYFARMPKASGT